MVYTDGIKLIADGQQELHRFAKEIVLSKCWYHPPTRLNAPYYDLICPHRYQRAIYKGASIVSSDILKKIVQEKFG